MMNAAQPWFAGCTALHTIGHAIRPSATAGTPLARITLVPQPTAIQRSATLHNRYTVVGDETLMVRVRLTRKFANLIDGIDLSHRRQGDLIDLSSTEARILMLEGWATAADSPAPRRKAAAPKRRRPRPKQ
jgi:hypothetical protein